MRAGALGVILGGNRRELGSRGMTGAGEGRQGRIREYDAAL
jgi:hypothetical protein